MAALRTPCLPSFWLKQFRVFSSSQGKAPKESTKLEKKGTLVATFFSYVCAVFSTFSIFFLNFYFFLLTWLAGLSSLSSFFFFLCPLPLFPVPLSTCRSRNFCWCGDICQCFEHCNTHARGQTPWQNNEKVTQSRICIFFSFSISVARFRPLCSLSVFCFSYWDISKSNSSIMEVKGKSACFGNWCE